MTEAENFLTLRQAKIMPKGHRWLARCHACG